MSATPLSTADAAPAAAPAHRINARSEGWGHAAAVVLVMTLAVTALFVAFGWPAVRSAPHDVPIGVAGPVPAAAQLRQGLDRAAEGAFAVARYDDEPALRRAILDREVYGGLSLGPGGPTLLTASAGSPAVAQALTALGTRLAAQEGSALGTRDVVPLPADDPRGAGLAAAALPITLGGILPAVLLALAFPRRRGVRLGAAAAFALAAGVTLTAVLYFWFGSVATGFWPVALGLALGMAAITLTLLGLQAVAGRAGLALGAAVVLLLGNPLSGLTSAPELLPSGWGALGQLLPPGANGTLLRSTAYFDGAAAGRPALVLSAWVALGLALYAVAALRNHRTATS